MTKEARDAYYLKEAQLEAIQRIKRAFPEWATNREVWRPSKCPEGMTTTTSWDVTPTRPPWVQPHVGVPEAHDDVRNALRFLKGSIRQGRNKARTYDQKTQLQRDQLKAQRIIALKIDKWRPRAAPKAALGEAGQFDPGVRDRYGCTGNGTLTFGHLWAARIEEHLDGDPVIDDKFVVRVEPHDHTEFQMFEVLLAATGSQGISLDLCYAVVHAGFRSSGATPEKAIALHRRRAAKAVREKFAA